MEHYRCVRKIGQGSYGEIWLVRNKKDKKHYVLKQINLQKGSERERRSAQLEAQLLATLRHPNIVSYRDSFEAGDGFLYIAMDYCEGGDLHSRIREQRGVPFAEAQVVEWFIQICMALQYLHDRNILHRDLKTQNIFLTRSKMVKVGDLGIAKVLDGDTAMATTLIGTPYYMSPELFSNRPYNFKSDVWALGCCVYELATLKHAFNARDINSLVHRVVRGKLPDMPGTYSAQLQDLIRVMLSHSPEKRPSVTRILRHPFIKKSIAVCLEGTRVLNKQTKDIGSEVSTIPASTISNKSPLKHVENSAAIATNATVELLDVQGTRLNLDKKSGPSEQTNHYQDQLVSKERADRTSLPVTQTFIKTDEQRLSPKRYVIIDKDVEDKTLSENVKTWQENGPPSKDGHEIILKTRTSGSEAACKNGDKIISKDKNQQIEILEIMDSIAHQSDVLKTQMPPNSGARQRRRQKQMEALSGHKQHLQDEQHASAERLSAESSHSPSYLNNEEAAAAAAASSCCWPEVRIQRLERDCLLGVGTRELVDKVLSLIEAIDDGRRRRIHAGEVRLILGNERYHNYMSKLFQLKLYRESRQQTTSTDG